MSDYNRGYEKLEAAEKLVIPEDLRGAYKTILELIKKGITLPWFGNREQRELIERIAQLEAQLSLLQWTAIEEGNLPKVGDEVYSMPQPGCFYPDEPGMVFNPLRVEDLRTFKGWIWAPRPFTHFRPINPPAPPTDKEQK